MICTAERKTLPMKTRLQEDQTYRILDACLEVYQEKGSGFEQSVYRECLGLELHHQHIPHHGDISLPLTYKGKPLRQSYQPDFICFDGILVELIAGPRILPEHRARLLNFLQATNAPGGLLVNFGHYPRLEHEKLMG